VFRTAGPPVKRDASFETTLAENQARGTEGSNPLPSSGESGANRDAGEDWRFVDAEESVITCRSRPVNGCWQTHGLTRRCDTG